MSIYTYSIGTINGGVDASRLLIEIQQAGYNVSSVYLNNSNTEVNIESSEIKEHIDIVVAAHEGPDSLTCHKKNKFLSIDIRTNELISGGFIYAGKRFSLSQQAQSKMMGVHQIRDDPMLTYPIKWNTNDDNDYYDVIDSADMHTFFMTGVSTYKAWVDAGTALKDQVRAATSKEEVDAIIDNR